MLQMLRRRWFLFALLGVLVTGMLWARLLASVVTWLPRDWIIGSVLLAMALPLPMDAMWRALRRPGPVLLAVAINLVFIPLLAWFASHLLIDDLAVGLLIASAVPCTLASATVWTRIAGGNEAVSLLVTMLTNLSCFLVTPVWLKIAIGAGSLPTQFGDMVVKLLIVIVLPLVLAQLLRKIPLVSNATATRRGALGIYAQLGILVMVFIAAVHCGIRLEAMEDAIAHVGGQVALMLVLVAAVHLVAWGAGYWSAGKAGMARQDQIAVAFAGSQKTITVGLAVVLQPEFGGLAILPMLAYHVEQLLLDTLLAERLRRNQQETSQ